MKEVGVYEAKTHLGQLLERVAGGERFLITRHGAPIAMLIPAESGKRRPVEQVIRDLRAFGRGRTLGSSIREAIGEGRRH